tara:strand:- start:2244 stop:2900 length:657 start_codon:yes stop_codon:yes gene_type:complete
MLPFKSIRIAFSNKETDINNAKSLIAFSNTVNLDSSKLVTVNQIHSSKILIADSPGFYDPADGIINKSGNLVCSIKVADCLPIFFVNNTSKTIGLVHAGWKGISSGIIKKFVNSIEICNENVSDFYVLIGPSIHPCCFEIRDDVLDFFDPKFYTSIKKNKYNVDLQAWVVHQLIKFGFSKEKIKNINKCTFCLDDLYHSYRRDGSKAGRMYAIAGWLN